MSTTTYRWLNEMSQDFLDEDYLLPGQTVDQRVNEICEAAEVELKRPGFAKAFKSNFQKGWYSFSTPIWTNFGNDRGLPISCFGSCIDDSMTSIVSTWAEVAMMTKYGGGTSAYFGNLRERGAAIKNNGTSSGSVHFMQPFENLIQVISQGSCYIEGTEVLTDSGFKDFRDVKRTDKIADLDENSNVSFTSQFELVVQDFEGDLVAISGRKRNDAVSIKVTPNHRMIVNRLKMKNREQYWSTETEIVEAKDLCLHRDNRLILSGWAGEGNGLTDEDRLRIAFQADGIKDGPNRKIRFHFSKERKIKRLIELLIKMRIPYDTYDNGNGTLDINFDYIESVKKNTFRDWICLDRISGTWAKEFLEEIAEWDGSHAHGGAILYCSTIKDNVDLVQAISALADLKTRLSVRPAKDNRQNLYKIIISEGAYRSGEALKVSQEHYKGKVYCAVVPKGRLIVRYEGRVLVCGNTRRGNLAAYLPIDHPDIMEFLRIRSDGAPIQDLSFGVCVPDYWMREMIGDASPKGGDRKKREVWARVLECRANIGYPYIFFPDAANRNAPDCYRKNNITIKHTNLCVTGDQRVVSDRGLKTAKELYEESGELKLFDNDKVISSSPMRLVEKNADVYRITLENGMTHTVTGYHKVKVLVGQNWKNRLVFEDVPCTDLKAGDLVAVQTKKGLFGKRNEIDKAFLLGLYQGDGTQTEELRMIDVWEKDFDLLDEIQDIYDRVCAHNNTQFSEISQRIYETPKFVDCVVAQSNVKKKRLVGRALAKLGFEKGVIPNWIWDSTEETQWAYIKGLFYTDGTVFVSKSEGNPIQLSLASIDKEWLKQVQILLSNLGMQNSIRILREAGEQLLPDGKGGQKLYNTKDCYRLIIGNKNDAIVFNDKTGFLDRKNVSIERKEYRDNTKKFYAVESIEHVGKEDVYCCTVESDEHHWVCNGVVTHNCTEIMLPNDEFESFVCDLSSMNILYYDEWKGTDAVELMVYFLDAVMSEFIRKAKKIQFMERPVRFAERHRALGIGWLGWHTYLQSKMIPWESMEAKTHNVMVAKNIRNSAYAASAKMATEYGEPEVLKGFGRRHATLLAIAPTKSSAFILGQVSEGIEPHRTNHYIKDLQKGKYTIRNTQLAEVLASHGKDNDFIWLDILKKGGTVQHLDFLSEHEKAVFKTFAEISQKEVIIQAAQRQKYIDQGQSLNLMIHPSIPTKEVNALMIEGWKMDIKSYYYQNSVNAAQTFARNILACTNCEA